MVIRQLSRDLACTWSNGFREWGYVTCVTIEHCGAQVIAAEIWMIQDVKEFRAELQHPSFSQKPKLGVLDERKIPISFGRSCQNITSGSA